MWSVIVLVRTREVKFNYAYYIIFAKDIYLKYYFTRIIDLLL